MPNVNGSISFLFCIFHFAAASVICPCPHFFSWPSILRPCESALANIFGKMRWWSCAVGSDSGINNECEIPITSQLHKDWFCTQFTWNEVSNMNAWRTFNWWLAFVVFLAHRPATVLGHLSVYLFRHLALTIWNTKVYYQNAPCYAMQCNTVHCIEQWVCVCAAV